MINQKKLHNKIKNNNNINTKTIKITKTKQLLLIFYVLSSLLILTLSIFSVQTGLAQVINENETNNVPITNINTNTNKTSETTLTADSKKPMHVPNQIVIVAEDIEEIRDNLQEAREALNNANYLEVLSHINNIDQLLTAFVISGSSTFVDNKNNNTTTNTTNVDLTALAHLNNSSLIKKYNELIKDFNKKYDEKIVIN